MITKDGGLKFAKLIHVSVDNGLTAQSNKVYLMEEQADGRIKCEYGRVGKALVTVYKSSYEWDKVYRSKVNSRKGYTDVTDMVSETVAVDTSGKKTKAKSNDIKDLKVKNIFDDLMAFANKSIKQNYKVSQEAVTQLQVDRAQDILNRAVKLVKKKMDVKEFNNVLIELYTVIPRKMDDVRDHLASSANDDGDLNWINNFLSSEQDTLDAMAGQVKLINQQKDTDAQADEIGEDDADEITILEQMGLKAEIETDQKSIDLVTKLMGSNSGRIRKILKVINVKTQTAFDKNLKNSKDKTRRMYWHGSRNENWFNIIQTGLMIRPSGAVHTGSMFGDGIYFANKAQKSIGYSSLRGSYWAGGSSNKGYLALFDVHTGNQKHITRHDSSCYSLSKGVMDREGTDSVYAHGGMDLRNDEFIIYEASKCTISYLVEME